MPDTLALTIEGPFLQALEVRGQRVRRWARVPLPPRARQGGHVADPGLFGRCAQAAVAGFSLQGLQIVVALPSFHAVWRVLTLPPIPRRELNQMVQREIRRVLLLPETLATTWGILDGGGANPWRVYVGAVPREPLLLLVRALDAVQLRPRVVDLRAIALLRAAGAPTCISASVERDSTEVAFALEGVPLHIRATYLGVEASDPQYLQSRLIDDVLRGFGAISEVAEDVQRFPPDAPIVLSGELALRQGFAEVVGQETGRPVVSPRTSVRLPGGLPIQLVAAGLGCLS